MPMMNYHFANLEDASLLARLNKQLIDDEGHRNAMTVEQLEDRMRGWLDGEYRAVLFEHDHDPVGYALYRHDPEYIYFRHLFVCREHRRRGVGREAIAWLRANAWQGVSRVRIEVLVDNTAAIEFWRAVGFHNYCITMESDLPC
jgi:predicted acetyltransferase